MSKKLMGTQRGATVVVLPFASMVLPCRNEERFIAACLESIIANDYPKERLEVLVVDGMSVDRTRAIVEGFAQRYPFIRMIDNPKHTIPAAANIGVLNARRQIILKADAHSTYPPDYISKCVQFSDKYKADNTGGILEIVPGSETVMGKAIAHGLSHFFGSGNAYVKVGSREPCWADTAAFGCYTKEALEKVGTWNEDLAGSSDLDFNLRLKKAGGKTLLVPEIKVRYYSDPGLRSFWKHNFADGVWATYVLKFDSPAWAWRHWVPLAFVGSLLGSVILACIRPAFWPLPAGIASVYAVASFLASAQIALREKNLAYLFLMPLAFAVRHIAHGLGALYGLILWPIPGKHWKGRREAKA